MLQAAAVPVQGKEKIFPLPKGEPLQLHWDYSDLPTSNGGADPISQGWHMLLMKKVGFEAVNIYHFYHIFRQQGGIVDYTGMYTYNNLCLLNIIEVTTVVHVYSHHPLFHSNSENEMLHPGELNYFKLTEWPKNCNYTFLIRQICVFRKISFNNRNKNYFLIILKN